MKTGIVIFLLIIAVAILLYMFLIMPQITNKPDVSLFNDYLYAHRGLHDNTGDAPENSMAAFRKAVEAGFGMELDIQLTKDKQVVVFHDFTLKRICGVEGKVCDYNYEELQQFTLYNSQERIPKLAEVLKLVNGKTPIIVEFKGETLDISLCSIADVILREYNGAYCMESFNPLMVAWYRKNRREIVRGQLSKHFFKDEAKTLRNFALQHMLFNFYAKPHFIAYRSEDYAYLPRRICCDLYGAIAVVWTIRSQKELDERKKDFNWFIFDSFLPKEDR